MESISSDLIEAEALSCVALCINDWNYGSKDILLNGIENLALIEFLARFGSPYLAHNIHLISDSISLQFDNLKIHKKALDLRINQFDVVIDLKNISTESYDILLKPNGVLIINLSHLSESKDSFERAKSTINAANFSIKMPFCVNNKYYLFLSNKVHPLADISLQKIDSIDNLKYYNPKIGEAIFALPNYLKTALKNVVRN